MILIANSNGLAIVIGMNWYRLLSIFRGNYFCPFSSYTDKVFHLHLHLGPLYMSPVTGLARLPGQIVSSVHMGNFSLVNQDEIQETQPNGGT